MYFTDKIVISVSGFEALSISNGSPSPRVNGHSTQSAHWDHSSQDTSTQVCSCVRLHNYGGYIELFELCIDPLCSFTIA